MGIIVGEGYRFIGAALLLALVFWLFVSPYIAVVPLILSLYFAYFFRNPVRSIEQNSSHILSPADGTVQEISRVEYDEFLKGAGNKITVFMSVFNVHVNRSPITGEIKYQKYVCGRFRPAYKDSVGFENEHHLIGIENDKIRITVTQIAGILARRIVSWVTLSDNLEQGELYGMIRFGSCLEIVMPEDVEVMVNKGEKVIGGKTILGRIK
ncbi:MAG: phosphatidylserine decarboxylase family protein [Selenomonadaceae bacterium]|nr:phosphatidylserine decarboxylase family protein [Selenomonadaceae bacterium]